MFQAALFSLLIAVILEKSSKQKQNLMRLIKFHNFHQKLSKRNSHDFIACKMMSLSRRLSNTPVHLKLEMYLSWFNVRRYVGANIKALVSLIACVFFLGKIEPERHKHYDLSQGFSYHKSFHRIQWPTHVQNSQQTFISCKYSFLLIFLRRFVYTKMRFIC